MGSGGGGAASALAEVGDAVHAVVDRRVDAEAGLDAALARRVAAAGRRVHALAPWRDRLGAPAAAVAARPRLRLRLRHASSFFSFPSFSVPSDLDARVVAVGVVVPAAGFSEVGKSCEEDGEGHRQQRSRASSSPHLSL